MWNTINLWRQGIIIRKIDTFCYWMSLQSGTKWIITFGCLAVTWEIAWFIYRFFFDKVRYYIDDDEGIFSQRIVEWEYSGFGFAYDTICNMYNGQITYFSIPYAILFAFLHLIVSVFGAYVWIVKRFEMWIFQTYFNMYFIDNFFLLIHFSMMYLIISDEFYYAVIPIFFKWLQVFWLNSTLYSYSLEVEKKYRKERRKSVKKKRREIKNSRRYNRLNDEETTDLLNSENIHN